jgi:hypothetical protein
LGFVFTVFLGSHLIRDCKHQANKTCGKEGCHKHKHHSLHRDDTVSCTYEDFFDSTVEDTDIEVLINSDPNEVLNHIITDGGTSVIY